MRRIACRSLGLLAALLAGIASPASAQDPRLARGDVAGTIGWLSADTGPSGSYGNDNNWVNSVFGAASAGWYWTDHLKTELDVGAGTTARAFSGGPITIDGRTAYTSTASRFSRRTLGISQQYQFFHNVWFHPHLAAGANLTRELRTDHVSPIVQYDEITRTSRVLRPEQTDGPRVSVTVRPFVAAGFKAYMTPRAFFRSDLRVAFRGGPDETVLRLGFGVDF